MDLPIIIEIAESEEKIQAFLPILDEMIEGGLVTMDKVLALHSAASRRNDLLMTTHKFVAEGSISTRADSIRRMFKD
jgi:hypothetical protein